MRVEDVSRDTNGRWHLVGATPAVWPPPTPTSAAYAVVEDGIVQMMPIPLSWRDRRLLQRTGGAEQLGRVDAEVAPLLISSAAAALFDDMSSFIWMRAGKGWNVHRFPGQSIRVWIRDGPAAVTIITTEGLRYRTHDSGAHWQADDLRPAIRRVAPGTLTQGLDITAAASRAPDLLLAVSAHNWRLPEGQTLQASAVLHSEDDGRTFRVRTLVEGYTAEYRGLLMNS